MEMDAHVAVESAHIGMGTEMAHKAFGQYAQEALRAVEGEARRLERMFSRFRSESEIYALNKSAGEKCEKVSPETYEVLSQAIEFSRTSHGLFDATIAPLVDLWDYKNARIAPEDKKIQHILPKVNYLDLALDPLARTAMLRNAGQSIDLGGIGKGFASDRFMEIVQEYGIASAFSNIGGNVSTLGSKPDGLPWRVGLRHPRQIGLLGAVEVTGKAVSTSGDYERFFIDRQGRRFHHILNPFTGYPAQSGLVSVSVIADSAMTADALSTAVFIAGLEEGLDLIGKYPQAEAVLVNPELEVFVTRGLSKCFQTVNVIKTIYI